MKGVMTFLDYIKRYHNIDLFITLFEQVGYSDDEITTKLEVSRGTLYNARERVAPLLEALNTTDMKKITYGNPDINKIVETFSDCFGTTKVSKFDRFAAKRLAAKHSADAIVKVITALASLRGDKFCPNVNSVQHLEEKLPSVMNFLKQQSDNVMVEL